LVVKEEDDDVYIEVPFDSRVALAADTVVVLPTQLAAMTSTMDPGFDYAVPQVVDVRAWNAKVLAQRDEPSGRRSPGGSGSSSTTGEDNHSRRKKEVHGAMNSDR
jgi:hypothetical protein